MKKTLILIFLVLYYSTSIAQRGYIREQFNSYKQIIFVNGANVRIQPSLNAKILDTLPHNYRIPYYSKIRSIKDTINGVEGYWRPIEINKTIGYVWDGVMALSSFKTSIDIKNINSVLVDFSSEKILGFKVFNNSILIHEKYFTKKEKAKIVGATTIGKTFNSNNKEIFVVLYNDNTYDLFEWDGIEIKASYIELRDDSFITGIYSKYKSSIINSDKVNMRSDPNIESKIIYSLPLYSNVTIIDLNYITDTINNKKGYWSKVKWNNKTGFIWKKYISNSVKYIKSNIYENVSYVYTGNYIFAIRNNKIVSHIANNRQFENFYSKGSMGFTSEYEFLAVRIVGHGCGTDSGELFYIWNGEKIKYFGSSTGVGDGGQSWWKTLSFPVNHGKNNTVIEQESDGESLDFPPLKEDYDKYLFFVYSNITKTLVYKNDTLIEVPSIDLTLRNLLRNEFPKHNLRHYLFGDINQDGIDDALALISIESKDYTNNPTNTKVVVVYGKNDDTFQVKYINQDIVDDNFAAVDFYIYNNTFDITIVYNVGYEKSNGRKNPQMSRFEFVYEKKDDTIYWYSKTESEQIKEQRESKWETKTLHYKTNIILFEKAYNNTEFLYID